MKSTATPGKGMGRKPASVGHYGTQDAIWQAIRALESFTLKDLICHVDRHLKVNDLTVKSYVQRLERGGYLNSTVIGQRAGCRQEHAYTLIRNTGVETPRLRQDGKPSEQGRGQEQMWRAMKILRDFDWRDLAIAAGTEEHPIAENTAKGYCVVLAAAGYLAVVRASKPGAKTRYRFVPSRNSGPRPPQVQRVKQLFDPNLNQVVWRQGGGQ